MEARYEALLKLRGAKLVAGPSELFRHHEQRSYAIA
jgi:hypothetical protein